MFRVFVILFLVGLPIHCALIANFTVSLSLNLGAVAKALVTSTPEEANDQRAAVSDLSEMQDRIQSKGVQRVDSTVRWSPAPGSRPATVIDILSLTDIGGRTTGLLPTPDKSAIAFQMRRMDIPTNSYHIGWYVLSVTGGTANFIGDGGDLLTSIDDEGKDNGDAADPVASWSPDGRWLAYLKKTNGEVQIWRSRRDGSAQERLTHGEADAEAFAWLKDSSTILFALKASRKERIASVQKAREQGLLWDRNFAPRFGWLPLVSTVGDGNVYAMDIESKVTRMARPEEKLYFLAVQKPALTARPNARVIVTSDDGEKVASLEALDSSLQGVRPPLTVVAASNRTGQRAVICEASECTGQIVSLRWHPDGEHLYFVRLEGHADSHQSIYEWTIGSNATRRVYASDDWIGDDCVFLLKQAVCLLETPLRPRHIIAMDLDNGKISTLFDPDPAFSDIALTRVEKMEWRDSYGNDTFAHLVYPVGYRKENRYPLVIVQYRSRGFLRGGTGNEYPIHVLAAQGFFVVSWDRPEFRDVLARETYEGSARYGFSENRDYRAKLSALDVLLDDLSARRLVDASKVGMTGLSNGAQTTYMSLIHSKRIAVAAVSHGPDDPFVYYLASKRDREILKGVSGMTAPDNTPEARVWWNYVSPSLNVANITAPILMNLSDSEANRALQAVATLQNAKKPFEAYVYSDEFHIKNQPMHLRHILERNVDWFNFWLRDFRDPNPMKKDQYARWEALRKPPLDSLTENARQSINAR